MKLDLTVTFTADRELSQADGMAMWSLGSRFGTRPGRRTYYLCSSGEAPGLVAGVEGLVEQIEAALGRSVTVTAVDAAAVVG